MKRIFLVCTILFAFAVGFVFLESSVFADAPLSHVFTISEERGFFYYEYVGDSWETMYKGVKFSYIDPETGEWVGYHDSTPNWISQTLALTPTTHMFVGSGSTLEYGIIYTLTPALEGLGWEVLDDGFFYTEPEIEATLVVSYPSEEEFVLSYAVVGAPGTRIWVQFEGPAIEEFPRNPVEGWEFPLCGDCLGWQGVLPSPRLVLTGTLGLEQVYTATLYTRTGVRVVNTVNVNPPQEEYRVFLPLVLTPPPTVEFTLSEGPSGLEYAYTGTSIDWPRGLNFCQVLGGGHEYKCQYVEDPRDVTPWGWQGTVLSVPSDWYFVGSGAEPTYVDNAPGWSVTPAGDGFVRD